jgi:hypothetical protein
VRFLAPSDHELNDASVLSQEYTNTHQVNREYAKDHSRQIYP